MIAKQMSEMKNDWKAQLDKLSEEFSTLKDSFNETILPVTSFTEKTGLFCSRITSILPRTWSVHRIQLLIQAPIWTLI